MVGWIRTKSQERIYQSKQSSTLAPVLYVEVNMIEDLIIMKPAQKHFEGITLSVSILCIYDGVSAISDSLLH